LVGSAPSGPYDNYCKKWWFETGHAAIQSSSGVILLAIQFTETTLTRYYVPLVAKITELLNRLTFVRIQPEAIPSSYPLRIENSSGSCTHPYKKAIPKTGFLESIKATPTMGNLDTIKAIPTTGNLDSIKATETTTTLESIKATPTTGTLDTIKAVPKTETAPYEYSTFEVTEEEKLVDVYVDVPEDVDPPETVTDTFVGTPNLEARAWFFTRPKGGNYITDIRVTRITGGYAGPMKQVLEAWGGVNKVIQNYAGSERVELSKLVPTDQAAWIRIVFKATAPNGDYRKRRVFINVWDPKNPEANAPLAADLASDEEEE
jgi:hypothetical protein